MLRNGLIAAAICGLGVGCAAEAGTPQDELVGVDLAAVSAADAVHASYRGVELRGGPAQALYGLLDQAGASELQQYGRRILYTNHLACVTQGVDTYCEVRGYGSEDPSGRTQVSGRRFASAASDLFGVLSAAQDLDARAMTEVGSPWFQCQKGYYQVACTVDAPVSLALQFDGLEAAGEGYVYEGWVIVDGAPLTTGRFQAGESVDQVIPAGSAGGVGPYVLTIEPLRGDDPSPAATHVLAGDFEGGAADLSIAHPAALGTDFAAATGSYFLQTPTSPAPDDYELGIWFIDPAAGPGPSLALPALPEGWTYEGWIVTEDGPVSTGRFRDAAMGDSDAGGPYAGPNPAPPFPGQDFIEPPTDLRGTTVVLSVEPMPDDSPAPFAIKPLIDPTVEDVGPGVLQSMEVRPENAPAGTATIGS